MAEVFATAWQDYAGHGAAGSRKASAPPSEARHAGELVDETGAPVLYIGGRNYYSRACARITFPDQRWLRFLVRGTQPAHAIMTAVDHAGNKVARYRINGPVEIAVHPDRELTDELALAIAISAPWLGSYFEIPAGAG